MKCLEGRVMGALPNGPNVGMISCVSRKCHPYREGEL